MERRWSVDGLPGEEMLDVVADCYSVLASVLAEAHEQFGVSIESCEKTCEDPCGRGSSSERKIAMYVGRPRGTHEPSHLLSGASTRVIAEFHPKPAFDADEVRERYFSDGIESLSPEMELRDKARILHEYARRIFVADGHHVMLAWLFRDRVPVAQVLLEPERHAAKFLMIERLGAEATRLDAGEVILTTEAWEAPFDPDDRRRTFAQACERIEPRFS